MRYLAARPVTTQRDAARATVDDDASLDASTVINALRASDDDDDDDDGCCVGGATGRAPRKISGIAVNEICKHNINKIYHNVTLFHFQQTHTNIAT